jgi:hypothetical protein
MNEKIKAMNNIESYRFALLYFSVEVESGIIVDVKLFINLPLKYSSDIDGIKFKMFP